LFDLLGGEIAERAAAESLTACALARIDPGELGAQIREDLWVLRTDVS
jgi:hypothetical protein